MDFKAVCKASINVRHFKLDNKVVFIGLLVTIFLPGGCISNSSKVENLRTYAKAYGYVKYFHPSDEASQIDWVKFSAYGAEKIEKCRTKEQLVATLNDLFNPIAPSVRFSISKNKPEYDLKSIIPANTKGYRLTFWQHRGVGIGMKRDGIYKSVRVNSGSYPGEKKIFEAQPEFGTIITKEIGKEIYCQMPLVLYRDNKNTYPKADILAFKKLKTEIDSFEIKHDKLSLRLGNIIIVYNVFQHFYPYFDVVNVKWDNELSKALSRGFNDVSSKDELITLEKFTAPLKDGHIYVNSGSQNNASLPLKWEWVEDKLVITHTFYNTPTIKVGDIVTQINGVSSKKYFEEMESRNSAGTKGWLNYRVNSSSLSGEKGSLMKLKIKNKSVEIIRNSNPYDMEMALWKNVKPYMQLNDSIWYLNMCLIEMDTIKKLLPALSKCKAIICDARGYPKHNYEFITHLMQRNDTTTSWMQIPEFIYPDHEKVAGYYKANWIHIMKARKPYLGNKKIVYIIDGSAISYAESCLGYIEGYKLAILVGQPTAGTNGNVNPFDLPGGYTISWTGMKVLKHNGSQHHGIGILPTVYVNKTIQGIKENRDEFYDKAIEIAKQK